MRHGKLLGFSSKTKKNIHVASKRVVRGFWDTDPREAGSLSLS